MLEHLLIDPRHANNDVAVRRTYDVFDAGNREDGCTMSIFTPDGHLVCGFLHVWRVEDRYMQIR